MPIVLGLKGVAVFSKDKKYRYMLTREWDATRPPLMMIGLNPSTADQDIDDPTVRKCLGFAKRWKYGKLYMANVFSFRATYPKDLFSCSEPVGSENDKWIKKISKKVDKIILAYGNYGKKLNRHETILKIIKTPYCIKKTKEGLPMHPLYLKYTKSPKIF